VRVEVGQQRRGPGEVCASSVAAQFLDRAPRGVLGGEAEHRPPAVAALGPLVLPALLL
jgi:hypothetical protein